MSLQECNGDHGKLGMSGCLDPRWIDGELACYRELARFAKMSQTLAGPLIDLEQSFLDAHWDAGLFNDWKGA